MALHQIFIAHNRDSVKLVVALSLLTSREVGLGETEADDRIEWVDFVDSQIVGCSRAISHANTVSKADHSPIAP